MPWLPALATSIDAAKLGDDVGNGSFHRRRVRRVGLEDRGTDGKGNLFERLTAPANQCDPAAFACDPSRDGSADARAATGDDGGLACKSHDIPPCLNAVLEKETRRCFPRPARNLSASAQSAWR
jgi:hypothetical protein